MHDRIGEAVVPEGHSESSPAIYRWEDGLADDPKSRRDGWLFPDGPVVPTGLNNTSGAPTPGDESPGYFQSPRGCASGTIRPLDYPPKLSRTRTKGSGPLATHNQRVTVRYGDQRYMNLAPERSHDGVSMWIMLTLPVERPAFA